MAVAHRPYRTVIEQAPERFAPVLARLRGDARSYFGVSDLRLVPADVQERPFSHLLRVGVCRNGDQQPVSYLFVKVFKPKTIEGSADAMHDRVARDFEVTRQVYRAMSQYADVGAVPPVACYPDLLAIVTEQVAGPTLLEYLQAEARWIPRRERLQALRDTMTTVGRWIRVFQTENPTGGGGGAADLRQYMDVRLDRLVHHAGRHFTADDRRRVLDHIDRLGSEIATEELRQVTVHSDLSLGNLLVSGRRIVVLDFAMTRLDSRLHDVTKVFFQIELLALKPHFGARVMRQLQSALLQGFDPSLSPDRPLFRLILLLHRINHLTGLHVNRASLLQAMYNRAVRRHHRRRIHDELNRQSLGSAGR